MNEINKPVHLSECSLNSKMQQEISIKINDEDLSENSTPMWKKINKVEPLPTQGLFINHVDII